jgi:hypothetical protein
MISHQHQCIFIHIPKTAGKSIENFFLQNLGLSNKQGLPLLLGSNTKNGIGPPQLTHLTIEDLINFNFVNENIINSYYKFSFVRNPFTRAYSFYRYHSYDRIMNFDEYIIKKLSNLLWKKEYWFMKPQKEFIYSQGDLKVDFVGRYENLDQDFKKVVLKIGTVNTELPHINKASNFSIGRLMFLINRDSEFIKYLFGSSLRTYNGNCIKTSDIILDLYKEDFEFFDYSTSGP